MTDLTLRSRSVPEVVDAAFTLYRRNAPAYIMVSAIASAPGLLLQLLLLGETDPLSVTASLNALAIAAISLVTYALVTGVVIQVGSDVYLESDADVGRAMGIVLPKVPRLIVAAFLRVPLYIIGFICLFFGVFYVVARWFAVETAIVLEDKSATGAFGRSTQLSDGRKWHILRALVLVYGIYLLLAIAVSIIPTVIGGELASTIVTSFYTIVAYPLIALVTMVLYYDARIRGEGFDVQQMAASLGAEPVRA